MMASEVGSEGMSEGGGVVCLGGVVFSGGGLG